MRNTKIVSSWILLATIPSCLAFELEEIVRNDELYVLNYPTENELTRFSEDDDAALVWNDDLSTREPSDDFNNSEPVRPIENVLLNTGCAIWKSRQCFIEWSTSHDWKKVSSLTNPMAPVYDFRWEGFKDYVVHDGESKKVLSSDAEDGTIIFSIRGTEDVHIHLCKDTDVGLSPCSVIRLAVNGSYSSIEYCESRETRCYEQARTATRETAFLNADEWRTFRFQWIKNERKIKVFRDTAKHASLQSSLGELQFIRNISVSSSAPARIRFHDYNYNLATYQNSIIATKEFDWSDGSFCVNMLVSLCLECHLTVRLIDSSSNETLANEIIYRDGKYYFSGLREWQSFRLTLPSKSSSQSQVQLQFRAGLDYNDRKDVWWAIDDLRFCEQNGKNGVRKSTIKLPSSGQTGVGTNIKCQKLLRDKRITWVRCFRVIPGKRKFTLDYTSNFLPCEEVFGRFPLSVIVRQGHFELGRQACSAIPCQFDIVPLQPFTTYNVVVELPSHGVVFNENITTLESAPGAIRDVIFESITATSVEAKWKPPVYSNGIIRYYTVTIQKVESFGCKDYHKSLPVGPEITQNVTVTTASFFGLHPYTTYRFEVIANTVEPGPPYSEPFFTGQLDISTSQVSNLRIVDGSILVWDPPANCTAITGSTHVTKLFFRSVSTWVENFTSLIVIYYYKYDLNKLNLLPHTKYGVCAYIVRNHFDRVNLSNCQELQWTTSPDAPPADKKSPPERIETWLVILISILVICLLLLALFIRYWELRKTKMQTIDSQGISFDLRISIPLNSRIQSSDAQDLLSDPVHTASSENLQGQTRCAQNIPLEPPYMIPRDPGEQASHLQNVALTPVYMDIPNDWREESSHGEDVTSEPVYWEILDNSREQPSHPQDVTLAPLYMNTLDNSKGESSYPRDAPLDPEYLTILDDSSDETSYAQDIPLVPVYMNILDYSRKQTHHARYTP